MAWRSAASALSALLAAGCDEPQPRTSSLAPVLRDDLERHRFVVETRDGVTPVIDVDVGSDVASMLVEARGAAGFYFVETFETPVGLELQQAGQLWTREAREVPGLADFLFPNDDTAAPVPGRYRMSFAAFDDKTRDSAPVDEALEIEVITVHRDIDQPCGLRLDFLVDDDALGDTSFVSAVGAMVERVDAALDQVDVSILDYQIRQVDIDRLSVDVTDASALDVADQALASASASGSIRTDALHVLVVRSIQGEGAPGFNPAGYSMGLPGPYDADRPNAAVLVSTSHYARPDPTGTLVLDVDGVATSLTHEIGHFLGLYHTSEPAGLAHDPLAETAECTAGGVCAPEFHANLMTPVGWLTAAGLESTQRTTFTSGQGRIMRRHPLCLPIE